MNKFLNLGSLFLIGLILMAMECESLAERGDRVGPGTRDQRINRISTLEPNLTLDKVRLDRDATVLFFTYENHNRDYYDEVAVYPPGHRNAFYLTDLEKKRRFKLSKVEGIAMDPDFDEVRAGGEHAFSLSFEPIDPLMSRFHLIEGGTERENKYHWNFFDIEVDR